MVHRDPQLGTLSSTFTPGSLVEVINTHPKKSHSSNAYAKRIWTPYTISSGVAPNVSIRRVRSPWLACTQTYDDTTIAHFGLWFAFPRWTGALPGSGIFAGEGNIYYRIKYTIYVEFKYLFMNQ